MRHAILLALLLASCGGGGSGAYTEVVTRCGYFLPDATSPDRYVPGFTITLDYDAGQLVARTLEDEWGLVVEDQVADNDGLAAQWTAAWLSRGGDYDCDSYAPAEVADLEGLGLFDYTCSEFVYPPDVAAFIAAHRSSCPDAEPGGSITFFGVASTPSDNGSQAGPGAVAVTPPSSMTAGDLVVVYAFVRLSSGGSRASIPRMFTNANSATEHGGQRWNEGPAFGSTDINGRIFWCRFNGDWSADPSWRVDSSTEAMSVVMLVFRPSSSSKWWIPNVGPLSATLTAGSMPFTQTIASATSVQRFGSDSHVAVGAWIAPDGNTWDTLSGTGWSQSGLTAQYRNTTGAHTSGAFAYNIQTSSGATNAVSLNHATNGGDAGGSMLVVFTEIDPPSASGSAGDGSAVQSAVEWVENIGGNHADITASLASAVTSGNSVLGYVHFEDAPTGAVYLVSITDDQGNCYYPIRYVYDVYLNQCAVMFFRPDVTDAPQDFTVTISANNSFSFAILVAEIEGAWFYEDSAAACWQGTDSFAPEYVVAYPAITPPDDGRLVFLGVNLAGSGNGSDSWNDVDSFVEIFEHTRQDASDNNSALHSYVQASAASAKGRVQMTTAPMDHDSLIIMGVFRAPR